ncbi:YqaA family protein [Nannocystis bainbridge]|uniref:DedA family protein n=1 Tax=Nannocystis bainbridge TaxID=2995303 RepID=A0ABT5DYF7_9BACT|nr:YqaA family protein [Nannocystis bainbridge]MDC0717467.1 DedA family protein [Nannocystis bainbridge]
MNDPVSVPAPAPVASRNPLRRIYQWVLSWADTPYAVPALVAIAFVESSVFPIPPDVLLIALALSVPTRAFRFALWCTLGSVLGGLFGYLIGYALWSTFEPYIVGPVFSRESFELVTGSYQEHGELAVFIAAFTPIPYKVFTVAAGVAQLNIVGFALASILGRGGRFFLVAAVIKLAGPRAKQLIDKYFDVVTIVTGLLLVLGVVLYQLLR